MPVWAEVLVRDPWTLQSLVGETGQLQLMNTLARSAVRGRHLQPHPNSSVSLAGLIEGRTPHRARAGG